MTALKTDKLTVGYGRKCIVKNIDLEVSKGQIVCLLGPNGCGKTTILKTIAGLLQPISGSIQLNSVNVNSFHKDNASKRMAVVLTDKISSGFMTAFEVVSLGRYPHTGFMGLLSGNDINATNEAIGMVKADNIAHRYFYELSDGEKQKVMIARAIAQEPDILVLDEPIGHLDIHHRIEVLSILKKLSKEKTITVIMSLHEVDLALKISDLVVLIKDGLIIAKGSPEEILDSNTIKDLYAIEHGTYNHTFGNTEILPHVYLEQIFVTAGAGAGSPIYRMLSKEGYRVCTGVLHENDVDYFVATSLRSVTISEKPFEAIGEQAMFMAAAKMEESSGIIDAGYPVGSLNRANVDLTIKMIAQGKKILSVRDPDESTLIFGKYSKEIEHFASVVQLAAGLRVESNIRYG